ncbi:hypothetical protein QUA35_12240 [Microcoleus sp. N9_B2]|uniref:hypothetical protein n=1 Tax=unclassified Microcoleus TaxID=2642155 RepID=UPI002FD24218
MATSRFCDRLRKKSESKSTKIAKEASYARMNYSRQGLHEFVDRLLLDDSEAVEMCILFVEADTLVGVAGHGRARARMCRRLKHCTLTASQSQRLVFCITERLDSGHFSQQFKDQLRLALHLDLQTTLAVALACSNDSCDYVRRYAEWIVTHYSH